MRGAQCRVQGWRQLGCSYYLCRAIQFGIFEKPFTGSCGGASRYSSVRKKPFICPSRSRERIQDRYLRRDLCYTCPSSQGQRGDYTLRFYSVAKRVRRSQVVVRRQSPSNRSVGRGALRRWSLSRSSPWRCRKETTSFP